MTVSPALQSCKEKQVPQCYCDEGKSAGYF